VKAIPLTRSKMDTNNHKLKIGIIPDGNRKYAQREGIDLTDSYRSGAKIAHGIVKRSLERGDIERIVFYALAEKNMQRSDEEISAIIKGVKSFQDLIKDEASLSIQCWGRKNNEKIKNLFIEKLESPSLHVDLLINYSPEWDFETHPIRTHEIPDLDLIIRTNPIARLSGFLPKQSSYAILVPMETYWEEFEISSFDKILDQYKDIILKYRSGI